MSRSADPASPQVLDDQRLGESDPALNFASVPRVSRAQRRWIALVLVLITFLAYARTISFQFLDWDDDIHITNNPWMRDLSWATLPDIWSTRYAHLYIPLSYSLFAGETWFGQHVWPGTPDIDPRVFHLVSVLLHCGCVLTVFVLLMRLVPHAGAAVIGALVFALHPLQVESVCWVGEQRGLLSALLTFLALWQYIIFVQDRIAAKAVPALSNTGGSRRYIIATVCFALALLAKPSAISAPLMAAAIHFFLLERNLKRMALALAPWFLLALASAAITKYDQADSAMTAIAPVWARPLVAGDALAFYFQKLLVPVRLAFDYGRIPTKVMHASWFYWAWSVPVGLLALLLLLSWHRASWLAGAGVFLAGLLPVLGLAPFFFQDISTVADRYLYLPMLGVSLAAAAWLARHWSGAMAAMCGLVIGVWAAIGQTQMLTWRDNAALFGQGLDVNPNSFMAHYTLGLIAHQEGDLNAAESHFRRVLEIHPEYVWAVIHLGQIRAELNEPEKAIEEFDRALNMWYRALDALNGKAMAEKKLGRTDDARRLLMQALTYAPTYPLTLVNLGDLELADGNIDAAIRLYQQAVDAKPEFSKARLKLGSAQRQQAERAASQEAFDQLIAAARENLQAAARFGHFRESPASRAQPWEQLGGLLLMAGQFEESLGASDRALELSPDNVEGRFNRGAVLIELGRRTEGIAELRRALQLLPKDSPTAAHIQRQLEQFGESGADK